MKFIKTTDIGYVSKKLAEIIGDKLRGEQRVLWLLSGGSAIEVAVAAAKLLAKTDCSGLSIGLIDERYGPPGHPDSNWCQLLDAGFRLPDALMKPVLDGSGIEETARAYNDYISSTYHKDIFKIGLMGIGTDGHTAGLLPGSRVIDSLRLVDCYTGPDYQRITLTGLGIKSLDKAVVYAAGQAKKQAIDNLGKEIPPDAQPAQLLKLIGNTDVYNDIKGVSI